MAEIFEGGIQRIQIEHKFDRKLYIELHHTGDVAGYAEIVKRLGEIMKTIDEVLAAVTAESTKIDSMTTLLTSIKQQLADALSGTVLPPAVQAKVDAVFDGLQANAGKIDAALAANVPTP